MRKWTSHVDAGGDWNAVYQIVIPTAFRQNVLSLAHDHQWSGHLGITKTYDRVLRHFFWPGLKQDVAQFCRTCHTCQITGKPNQVIPPAPLCPIPVIGEPFEHVVVDCVGPLPKTKSGNQFLLTVMCMATRYPEAIPLRRITAPVVSKALIKFFSTFGLPKVVQTDQGTNFLSKLFKQVLKSLSVKHRVSSAYHPESQGALERWHQTLKSMLRKYCLESEKDWDEGVPLVLFAARETVQESLGFSPAELVFGHTVRGPMKVLKEQFLSQELCTG
uniref:Gypsy retrotransposon integrase-like protein 1 n=1 Tax=Hucho hucho TaxID=62062 RepID=A0A4W5LNZ8_9TELE